VEFAHAHIDVPISEIVRRFGIAKSSLLRRYRERYPDDDRTGNKAHGRGGSPPKLLGKGRADRVKAIARRAVAMQRRQRMADASTGGDRLGAMDVLEVDSELDALGDQLG
jgi:transposase-like protein